MRVLFLTSTYPSEDAPGYAPYMADQVRSLRAAGADIDLLDFNPRRTRLNYGLIVPRLIQKLLSNRHDVVHTHHTYSFLLADLARAVARSEIPVVLTNHEGEASDTDGKMRTWHPTSLLRHSLWLKRLAAKRADVTIYVSERLSNAVLVYGSHVIIPCGVDLDKFRPVERSWCREQLGIPHEAFVMFFPPDPKDKLKRFSLAEATFDIVRQHRRAGLLLTGGSIPHNAMPLYYNAADVILQSSYYEGSPTIVKEALACEVPVVSTDVGDTRDLVRGIPYCSVCRDIPEELAEHVLLCRGERAIGGRERLREKGLGLDQVAQRLIQIYRQAVIKKPLHSYRESNRQIAP
jgi:glycosyltransferase involved in cell wall biosynthesis